MSAKDVILYVRKQQDKFLSLNEANGRLLDFEQECLFARQQILKNDYTVKVAGENPQSLQAAILNVAAIGISLNPATAHAYLVPRDGAICLDISFRGLVALACDAGAIKWAKTELVYENDKFAWAGPSTPPIHEADPFSDRGELKGGYCLAKMPDGDYMVEVMSAEEIHKIRDTSKAYQKKSGPWINYPDEMAKKTITKRASKSWPQTGNRLRLDRAVEVLHESEGTAFTIDQHAEYMKLIHDEDALGLYAFVSRMPEQIAFALFNSFEKGQKTAMKDKARKLEVEGARLFREYKEQLADAFTKEDPNAAEELLAEMSEANRDFILKHLPEDVVAFIHAVQEAA